MIFDNMRESDNVEAWKRCFELACEGYGADLHLEKCLCGGDPFFENISHDATVKKIRVKCGQCGKRTYSIDVPDGKMERSFAELFLSYLWNACNDCKNKKQEEESAGQ